ncbi:DNA-directed RNA polymerase subunit L [Candidatus Micrarchaeota archaeon]|nr:DNA-directed RNA polymerase subunit L [Candidatus Micrarchaeota archaeon]
MEVNILNSDKKTLELEFVGVDHVIPQLLAVSLNNDKDVEFAAYKIDHVIDAKPRLFVKTKKGEPVDLVLEKLEQLKEQTADFRKQFKEAVK